MDSFDSFGDFWMDKILNITQITTYLKKIIYWELKLNLAQQPKSITSRKT